MPDHTDLTFITNDKGQNLLERFKALIKDTDFFDVLVGYFYTSGFYSLYKSLENTKKIRILIGIGTDKKTTELIQQAKQSNFQFSYAETQEHFSNLILKEIENAEDSKQVEEGIKKFLEWLVSGKLEIKAYPSQNLHAKLYIMTFRKGDRDIGRVITGSSNFTQSGLVDNLEFNVELKNRADYEFAKAKFEELWQNSVDVKEKYIETIKEKTWLNDTITPYQLYLKFLYEYFKDELSISDQLSLKYTPQEFKRLEYQEQAVLNAKKILEEYGGVFISDVVGLGKTYICAMLAQELDGRNLVIAPPALIDEKNPGSWRNIFSDFNVPADFESIGKLDNILQKVAKYKNIFIDEAHRFRTETTINYEKLARICRGKRVILVTATPYNNSPKDILSQIKLFQKAKKSTIPNLPDLEYFFTNLEKRLKKISRYRDPEKHIKVSKEIAKEIREKVLKYLMVRRTRAEIEKYFREDLEKNNLKFPKVEDPQPVFYELNNEEDEIFNKTIELIANKLKYARYTPLLYYKGKIDYLEEVSQRNMGRFMKILLIKRLESSFYAFRKTIERFIKYYEKFIKEFKKGNVYISKKYAYKIFDLLEKDDEAEIQRLIEEGKAKKYSAKDFKKEFEKDLKRDLEILQEIQEIWRNIKRDPKLIKLLKSFSTNEILKKQKIIIFTESKETCDYLCENLNKQFPNQVLAYSSSSPAYIREKVIENFDAKVRSPKNDYRILISTEVLSEGINLHRSNVVINYDIPWNPTRLMQRAGRINRVDSPFNKLYIFNFFPTKQSNSQIKLKEAAEAKIHAFLTLLGDDAKILTEGEPIGSHELFNRLISKKTITGEEDVEESELKYLQVIKKIRDNDPDLFAKIKQLPKKARTARQSDQTQNALLTYFRKGKLQKFFIASKGEPQELDFISAAKLLEATPDTKREKLGNDFYELLEKNKKAFEIATTEEILKPKTKGGRDLRTQMLKKLKATRDLRKFTEDQEEYLKEVIKTIEEGGLPKQTMKRTLRELEKELKKNVDPLKILNILQKNIPNDLLKEHIAENTAHTYGPREVILSEYFVSK